MGREVAAPAAVVWDLLVDTLRWPSWGPTVAGAEIRSGGVGTRVGPGATGTVWTTLGPTLPFRITDFVAGERWAWAPPYLVVCALALRRIEHLATS